MEQPPDGLLTWPKLLKIAIPLLLIVSIFALWNNLLLELAIIILALLCVSLLFRR